MTMTMTKGQTPTAARETRRSAETTEPTTREVEALVGQLRLLADATRMRILLYLEQSTTNVTGICERLGQSQPAVSHHLSLLRVSGVVVGNRRGKNIIYEMSDLGRRCVKAVKTMAG